MSYFQAISRTYRRDRYFSFETCRYKYIGQLKFNKISCPRSQELEVEREFREFLRQEVALANLGKYFVKFQIDHRSNSNDAVAFVTFEINADHVEIIERLDEVKFGQKFLAVRANGFTNEALNVGLLATVQFPYQRDLVSQFNSTHQPTYQINARCQQQTNQSRREITSCASRGPRKDDVDRNRTTKRARHLSTTADYNCSSHDTNTFVLPAIQTSAAQIVTLKEEPRINNDYVSRSTSTTGLSFQASSGDNFYNTIATSTTSLDTLLFNPDAKLSAGPGALDFYS